MTFCGKRNLTVSCHKMGPAGGGDRFVMVGKKSVIVTPSQPVTYIYHQMEGIYVT